MRSLPTIASLLCVFASVAVAPPTGLNNIPTEDGRDPTWLLKLDWIVGQ